MENIKHVDISELYDLFKERKACWFVLCDIKHMMKLNEISRKAGDMAILESMRRMQEAAGENDVVFRIGGDEFALLTDSENQTYADSLAEKIKSSNEDPVEWEGQKIPLTLHVGVTRFEGARIAYDELFHQLHTAISDAAKKDYGM